MNEFKEIITNKHIPLDIYAKLEQFILVYENNVDHIISVLMTLSKLDQFDSFYKDLFERILKDKSTRVEYFKSIITYHIGFEISSKAY